jgi:hypothetical protein
MQILSNEIFLRKRLHSPGGAYLVFRPIFFCFLIACLQAAELYPDLIPEKLNSGEEERIKTAVVMEEMKVLEAIRDLVGEKLDADEAEELQETIFQKKWDFMLPAGMKNADGGVTAHVFNLRFGPCALRVITKSKEVLQRSLFILSVMLNHSNHDENNRTDRNWENKVKALESMCIELGVYREEICEAEDTQKELYDRVKQWNSYTDVPIPSAVEKHLGQLKVYIGKGEDVMVDRIYIREVLRRWVDGSIFLEDMDCGGPQASISGKSPVNLHHALEAFDIWLPCQVLDQYCCLSDIPGTLGSALCLCFPYT